MRKEMSCGRTGIKENSPEAGLEGRVHFCEGESGGAGRGVIIVEGDVEEAARNRSVVDD